jgi:hypothetical protein
MANQIPDIKLGFTQTNTKPLGPIAADPPRGVYMLKSTGVEYQNSSGYPRLEVRLEVVSCAHPIDEGSAEAGGSVRLAVFLPNKKDANKDDLSLRRIAQVWAASGRDPALLLDDKGNGPMALPKLAKILGGGTPAGFEFPAHIIPRDPNVKGDNTQIDALLPAELEAVKAGKLTITKSVRRKKGADDEEADDLGDAGAKGGTGDDDDDKPAKTSAGSKAGAGGKAGAGAGSKAKSNANAVLDDEDEPAKAPAGAGKAGAGKTTKPPANPFSDDE